MEMKSPKEDKNATDSYPSWFNKNQFKKILAIIGSNKFSYKNKTGVYYMRNNSRILALKTWLIILEKIQLMK